MQRPEAFHATNLCYLSRFEAIYHDLRLFMTVFCISSNASDFRFKRSEANYLDLKTLSRSGVNYEKLSQIKQMPSCSTHAPNLVCSFLHQRKEN